MKPRLSILTILVIFLTPVLLRAQILKPATWDIHLSKTEIKAGEELEIIFNAAIDDKWYLYANDFDPDCGPILAELKFEESKNFELLGELKAIDPIEKHEEVFGCDVKIFKKKGQFRQRVRVTGTPVSIAGSIEGQVCTEIDGSCVNFVEDFAFNDLLVTGTFSPGKKSEPSPKVEEKATPPQRADKGELARPDTVQTAQVTENFAGPNKGPILDPAILEGIGWNRRSKKPIDFSEFSERHTACSKVL